MYNPKPAKVIYMYKEFQNALLEVQAEMSKKGVKFECVQAVDMCLEDLAGMTKDVEGQTLVVYDDCTEQTSSSSNIADIAMRGRHKYTSIHYTHAHIIIVINSFFRKISLVLLWHTLFPKGPQARLISLNTTYFFLMSSMRIRSQVKTFASQNSLKALPGAFENVLAQEGYGYIMVNLHRECPDFARVRTNILPNEIPHYVFVPSV